MASASRLPIKAIAGVTALGLALGAAKVDLKSLLLGVVTGPGNYSRILAIVVVLANTKSLPFVWHVRVLGALFSQMYMTKTKPFSATSGSSPYGPSSLFQPVITSSLAPVAECDYNLHKSNSTYFSDLDVSRSHLVCCLMRQGIQSLMSNPGQVIMPDGNPSKGKWGIVLGSVQCSFKREIQPYESYEMWSRVLCWDRKWLYIVTHFVKKGAVRPDGYTLDDGSFASRLFRPRGRPSRKHGKHASEVTNGHAGAVENIPNKAVFASAISKYVMKLGRLTIHPEVILNASGLLPPKPNGWNTMSGDKVQSNGAAIVETPATTDGSEWDWTAIEAENARGMKFAEHFAALDDLAGEFTGADRPALGVYRDLLW
ncbi:MAG: hypothetical protein M1818_006975 [Claussenomyces sp. TS43310]|nr:MAG: hypothetical protein M1818_006975 [Claussenomyces sp. TS43310]